MKKTILLGVITFALSASLGLCAEAKAIYDKDCAKCHGADGKGKTKMGEKMGAKDYTDAKVQSGMKDEEAIKAIKEGLKSKDGKTLMKPSEGLKDEDIKALVKYMRSFKK